MILFVVWLCLCMIIVGLLKLFSVDVKVGFFVYVFKFVDVVVCGEIFVFVKMMVEMNWIIVNDCIDVVLIVLFLCVVVLIFGFGICIWFVVLKVDYLIVSEMLLVLVFVE